MASFKKNFAKVSAFFAIFIILFCRVNSVLSYDDTNGTLSVIETFYALDEDSMDAVFVGPSTIYSTIIPTEMFQKNGVSTCMFSTPAQQFYQTQYIIDECEKTQSPEVYFVEIRSLTYGEGYVDNIDSAKTCLDVMRPSMNRYEAIVHTKEKVQQLCPEIDIDIFEWTFRFYTYHNRWKEITSLSADTCRDPLMGYLVREQIEYEEDSSWVISNMNNKPTKLPCDNEEYLNELLRYLKENDINVVFLNMPGVLTAEQYSYINEIKDIIIGNGYEFIDFNQICYDENIDFTSIIADKQHCNLHGAMYISDYLSDYMMEEYSFVDKRGNKKYDYYISGQEMLESTYGLK